MRERGRQLRRCLQLQRDIRGRQITTEYLHELARRYAVTTRTIRRDLLALRTAGDIVRYGTGNAIDTHVSTGQWRISRTLAIRKRHP